MTDNNIKNFDTALTDAMESTEGSIKPYDAIQEYLSEHFDIVPKGHIRHLVSEAWDASKDRESFLWDEKPWKEGPYTPKTKEQWMNDNLNE